MSEDEASKKLKLRGFPLQNIMKQSRYCDYDALIQALNRCLETDFNIKSGVFSADEADIALETLIVELCR